MSGIGNYLVDEASPWAAWQITDQAVIAMLARGFESAWMRADVWHGEKRSLRALEGPSVVEMAAGVRTTARQRALLRLVASGMQRPRMAAQMGVPERTLDTMLGTLKEQFGCTSGTLHELAYKFALSPDRQVDDGAGESAA
ncbi:hypothetical protein [Streptomyces chilikensis]|uniref:HTH luxR-type domain-containing protein n=1 Tax=Streptomyces chilikensis TaxID=1194079 RepID=A0ABV3ERS4_9ACTN